jgi:alpha-mannosidase
VFHTVRWTLPKIERRLALIEPLAYRRRQPLPPFRLKILSSPLETPPVTAGDDDADWPEILPNTYWEKRDTNFVLRCQFLLPDDWPGDSPTGLYLPLGEPGSFSHPEALAYVDGEPFATCDRHHQEILLPDRWRDGRPHLLALHGWTGSSHKDGEHARLLMRNCEIVQVDPPTRAFAALARVTLDAARHLNADVPAREHLLNALDDAFKTLDTREPFDERFYASVPDALQTLRRDIEQAGAPLDVDITAVGHAHIDVAWLWTLGQTRRKAGRTFHTVLRLMEQFPDYHFTQSQPQLYDFVRQDYPALFEAIRQRAAEGRWEIIGGMWVEADCNISGPESLARQFLLGRSFFRRHFGENAESPVLWLPDVFGYAANLPQLLKLAGLDYFFTIKIGWNQYNKMPYDSFWWQGVDGTKVLTHFSTTPEPGHPEREWSATYNAEPTPETALGTWRRLQHKEAQSRLLMSYGYGDGGGGPTREMLENIREMAAFPALPRVRFGRVGDFFRALEAEAGDRLPTWNGELYLELHRGTYTTQGRNKRANRRSEFLLHDAEFLAALAALLDPGYGYPAETFRNAWELVCLNQFHDIIPGSSIGAVYEESLRQYEQIEQMAAEARDAALQAIAGRVGGDLMIVNPSGFFRDDLVFWPGHLPEGRRFEQLNGLPVWTQQTETGTWIAPGTPADSGLPPFSVTPLMIVPGQSADLLETATGVLAAADRLENRYLRVEFNAEGDITRIYDKRAGREVLPPGAAANQFQAFEDRPLNWDAWDIDIFYDDKMWLAEPADSIRVIEAGPLRAALEIKRRILNSSYTQVISLACNSRRLDIETGMNWRERHILLKVAFPVDILSPVATYEIQWGSVQRPTHRNTGWDWARFETCAQKWADLSEGDYGVSLLNNGKYGHDIHDNVIRLSLLRSPTMPDEQADQGEHCFTYSLLPHPADWRLMTAPEAYALNDPLIAVPGSTAPGRAVESPVMPEANNIIIETVKQAEDGGGLIVRLYEYQQRRGTAALKTGFNLQAAYITDLLERNQEALAVGQNRVLFSIRPYQIITLRLIPAVD